jgi:N-acetylglutamate synthase-like GNAT family acetyltransferase
MVVRVAKREDIEAIWNVLISTIGEQPTRADELWEQVIQDGGMFVAEMEHTIVGFGALSIGMGEIQYLYILPEYQNSGIGKLILQELEEVARENAVDILRVDSTLNAVGFYKSAGYKVIEYTPPPGITMGVVFMYKQLKDI